MALRIQPFLPKSITCFSRFPSTNPYPRPIHIAAVPPRLRVSICRSSRKSNNRLTDSQLASELAKEVEKIYAQMVQIEEALTKSRELLFKEMCDYLGMATEEVKKRWKQMSEDDKSVLVKNFVSDWGSNFHPLSAKSVKEMVDDYLGVIVHEEDMDINVHGGSATTTTMLSPSLRRLIGFSQNNNKNK